MAFLKRAFMRREPAPSTSLSAEEGSTHASNATLQAHQRATSPAARFPDSVTADMSAAKAQLLHDAKELNSLQEGLGKAWGRSDAQHGTSTSKEPRLASHGLDPDSDSDRALRQQQHSHHHHHHRDRAHQEDPERKHPHAGHRHGVGGRRRAYTTAQFRTPPEPAMTDPQGFRPYAQKRGADQEVMWQQQAGPLAFASHKHAHSQETMEEQQYHRHGHPRQQEERHHHHHHHHHENAHKEHPRKQRPSVEQPQPQHVKFDSTAILHWGANVSNQGGPTAGRRRRSPPVRRTRAATLSYVDSCGRCGDVNELLLNPPPPTGGSGFAGLGDASTSGTASSNGGGSPLLRSRAGSNAELEVVNLDDDDDDDDDEEEEEEEEEGEDDDEDKEQRREEVEVRGPMEERVQEMAGPSEQLTERALLNQGPGHGVAPTNSQMDGCLNSNSSGTHLAEDGAPISTGGGSTGDMRPDNRAVAAAVRAQSTSANSISTSIGGGGFFSASTNSSFENTSQPTNNAVPTVSGGSTKSAMERKRRASSGHKTNRQELTHPDPCFEARAYSHHLPSPAACADILRHGTVDDRAMLMEAIKMRCANPQEAVTAAPAASAATSAALPTGSGSERRADQRTSLLSSPSPPAYPWGVAFVTQDLLAAVVAQAACRDVATSRFVGTHAMGVLQLLAEDRRRYAELLQHAGVVEAIEHRLQGSDVRAARDAARLLCQLARQDARTADVIVRRSKCMARACVLLLVRGDRAATVEVCAALTALQQGACDMCPLAANEELLATLVQLMYSQAADEDVQVAVAHALDSLARLCERAHAMICSMVQDFASASPSRSAQDMGWRACPVSMPASPGRSFDTATPPTAAAATTTAASATASPANFTSSEDGHGNVFAQQFGGSIIAGGLPKRMGEVQHRARRMSAPGPMVAEPGPALPSHLVQTLSQHGPSPLASQGPRKPSPNLKSTWSQQQQQPQQQQQASAAAARHMRQRGQTCAVRPDRARLVPPAVQHLLRLLAKPTAHEQHEQGQGVSSGRKRAASLSQDLLSELSAPSAPIAQSPTPFEGSAQPSPESAPARVPTSPAAATSSPTLVSQAAQAVPPLPPAQQREQQQFEANLQAYAARLAGSETQPQLQPQPQTGFQSVQQGGQQARGVGAAEGASGVQQPMFTSAASAALTQPRPEASTEGRRRAVSMGAHAMALRAAQQRIAQQQWHQQQQDTYRQAKEGQLRQSDKEFGAFSTAPNSNAEPQALGVVPQQQHQHQQQQQQQQEARAQSRPRRQLPTPGRARAKSVGAGFAAASRLRSNQNA